MEAKIYDEPVIDQPQSEKSLRDAFETLKSKVEKLKDLKEKSNVMISKFNRDFSSIDKKQVKEGVIAPKKNNYTDLFYSIADNLEKYTYIIDKNIEEMINLIG